MELMIVVAIIALVAAMLMPAINSVRTSAKSTDCRSRMMQIHMGFQQYLTTRNKNQFPRGYVSWRWDIFDAPYLGTANMSQYLSCGIADYARIFYCIEDRIRPDMDWSVFIGGAVRPAFFFTASHGFNWQMLGTTQIVNPSFLQRPLYFSEIAKPSATVLVGDTLEVISTNVQGRVAANAAGYYPGSPGAASNQWPMVYPRHKGNTECMILWADGSSSSVRVDRPDNYAYLYTGAALGINTSAGWWSVNYLNPSYNPPTHNLWDNK
jgi:hypothetical protein